MQPLSHDYTSPFLLCHRNAIRIWSMFDTAMHKITGTVRRCALATIVIAAAMTSFTFTPANAEVVVLENFTGLSCDQSYDNEGNLKNLIQTRDDVIVLGCHTNYIAEEEIYAHEACAEKQIMYLFDFPLISYSPPTIVINGQYITKGNYTHVVNSGVNMARAEDQVLPLTLRVEDNILRIDLPDIITDTNAKEYTKNINYNMPATRKNYTAGQYELWFYAYDNNETIQTLYDPLGEDEDDMYEEAPYQEQPSGAADNFTPIPNAGNTPTQSPPLDSASEAHIKDEYIDIDPEKIVDVHFTNVTKHIKLLGVWHGRAETISIPLQDLDTDGYAIIAQYRNAGPVVAAGRLEKKNRQHK